MKKVIKSAVLMVFLSTVVGCATKMSDVTDEESLTMKEIYEGSFNGSNPKKSGDKNNDNVEALVSHKRKILDGAKDLKGYTRTVNNENQVLFKRIKNPILVGYVFAHLTKDDIPIPAYSIPFRMSPKDYYAMPGEDQSF